MKQDLLIQHEPRRTLALKVTPRGLVASIPVDLELDDARVQSFIKRGLAKFDLQPSSHNPLMTHTELVERVANWSQRLGVTIQRVQIRWMRNKWASCSSKGVLTLNADLLRLPLDLVDYVICHDLLHLKIPNHGKGFQTMLGCYMPDWREREMMLAGWLISNL